MFRGTFTYGVDGKGRVAIPSKFREILTTQFDERLIVTHFDQCLWAYPVPVWQEFEKKIANLPQFLEEVKALQRVFIASAAECPLDKQGRILLPSALRDYSAIGKEAVVVGMTQRIEIWSKERWEKVFEASQEKLESMQEKLAELGL
ncbi:MAG: division/cell wall cluster transcriptional repressor MraZ [Deltaproteobacteria bacterium RIFCSPLOWO2_02_FULL_46_8]|nr:division/cell wall cluster transcriptional repressor MraZ [Deltaproteobacteria bacterium]OGQ48189.1 MAG: division/cell wall cluster transcriptional repressor MraZ [Deltaproteobacteria bacterium RIFCSPLOWO2_02_FULL_46_8]